LNSEIIKKIREFNRYYTVWLNVLNKGYLGTDFSWTESRVLFEIDLFQGINATELCEHLNMDKSHISRILAKFEKQGLLTRELILGSKGLKKLWLTEAGKREAQEIDQGGDKQILDKLKTMDDETCDKLCEAMVFIEKTLRDHDKKGIEK
jgi:DNA-binding MarR family transcriptional regulator